MEKRPIENTVRSDFGDTDTDYNYNPNECVGTEGIIQIPPLPELDFNFEFNKFDIKIVEEFLAEIMGIEIYFLHKIRKKYLEQNTPRILRVFVQATEDWVKKGVQEHIDDAEQDFNSQSVLILEDILNMKISPKGYKNIMILETRTGDGKVADKFQKLLNEKFPNWLGEVKDYGGINASQVIYKLILSYLGIEKVLLGGSHRDLCMMHFAKAAHSLGSQIKLSKYHAV